MGKELTVHVLFRFFKKSGKIEKTVTALGSAQLNMWAMLNTPKNRSCLVFERESGRLVFATEGTDYLPKVRNEKECAGETCKDYSSPLDILHGITDPRFDTEETEAAVNG